MNYDFSFTLFRYLEDRFAVFELRFNSSSSPNVAGGFEKIFQGPRTLQISTKLPKLDSSVNLAIPLQALGAVQAFHYKNVVSCVFQEDVDFSQSAFECNEPLKVTKFWQDSSLDLQDILKVNFDTTTDAHDSTDEVIEDPGQEDQELTQVTVL